MRTDNNAKGETSLWNRQITKSFDNLSNTIVSRAAILLIVISPPFTLPQVNDGQRGETSPQAFNKTLLNSQAIIHLSVKNGCATDCNFLCYHTLERYF